MSTIYKEFKKVAEANSRRPAVYWKEAGRWRHYHYKEFIALVRELAGGLGQLGLKKGERVAILSENRPEWLATDLAANKLGAVSVPIHATANEAFIGYLLADSGSRFLVVSKDLYLKHQRQLDGLKSIRLILIGGEAIKSERIISFEEMANSDLSAKTVSHALASIVYTSGTTGEPKGVMLTNRNFLANILAARNRINVTNEDKFLSFLPLSHVLERTAGSFVPILSGAAIAYAESIKKLADNLGEARPTILISVPKIFEAMDHKIMAGIKSKNLLVRRLFFDSFKLPANSLARKTVDLLLYRKIRQLFGGRLRFAVTGGASINERILKFFKNLGVIITEGYGLTETSPVVAANSLKKIKIGTVGPPLEGVEVKIAPDKEVLVKAESVMSGYWQKPELTREAFTEDGWLKTGDLGFMDNDGFLTIIGRKKEMIVLSSGKKVSPEKIETTINLSPYISQSLSVGHRQNYLAALIIPDQASIKEVLGEKVDLNKLMAEEIDKINKAAMPHEAIKKFKIIDKPFTIEADELTPTLKIRRQVIENKYRKEIERLYKD